MALYKYSSFPFPVPYSTTRISHFYSMHANNLRIRVGLCVGLYKIFTLNDANIVSLKLLFQVVICQYIIND